VKRRAFITLLGCAAAAWPLAARAQAMPTIGFMRSTPSAPFAKLLPALRDGLNEEGFTEGRNVAIEQRYADNRPERLPEIAADLVSRKVSVIVGNGPAATAARAATATIPIVFVTGDDPVRAGLVVSLSRPGGNLTGVTFFGSGNLTTKRLEILHELVPKAEVIAVLIDSTYPGSEADLPVVEAAAGTYDWGARHRRTHPLRGPGDGIRAQVNQVHVGCFSLWFFCSDVAARLRTADCRTFPWQRHFIDAVIVPAPSGGW
jgi:putative ABC transport system substrate-binding protein